MKAEIILTNDGSVIFACDGPLKAPVTSVEFYKDSGAFIFNYDLSEMADGANDDDNEMLDMELQASYHDHVCATSKALITWVEGDRMTRAFDVPFIHVG